MRNFEAQPLAERPRLLTRRAELALFLVPMALAFTLAQVAKAIWPTLLAKAPWTLLVMSVSPTRALLVQPLVPAAMFFTLAIARPLIMAPLYYTFGRRYGDVALRWVENKLGPTSTVVPNVERIFRRFSYPLVAWSPTMLASTMAGAIDMPAIAFFPLAVVGTAARVTILYLLGDVLAAPLKEVADFVGRYQLYLTPLTLAIVVIQLWRRRRRTRGLPIETLDAFEAELEETAWQVAAEAAVHTTPLPGSPRER